MTLHLPKNPITVARELAGANRDRKNLGYPNVPEADRETERELTETIEVSRRTLLNWAMGAAVAAGLPVFGADTCMKVAQVNEKDHEISRDNMLNFISAGYAEEEATRLAQGMIDFPSMNEDLCAEMFNVAVRTGKNDTPEFAASFLKRGKALLSTAQSKRKRIWFGKNGHDVFGAREKERVKKESGNFNVDLLRFMKSVPNHHPAGGWFEEHDVPFYDGNSNTLYLSSQPNTSDGHPVPSEDACKLFGFCDLERSAIYDANAAVAKTDVVVGSTPYFFPVMEAFMYNLEEKGGANTTPADAAKIARETITKDAPLMSEIEKDAHTGETKRAMEVMIYLLIIHCIHQFEDSPLKELLLKIKEDPRVI